MRMASFVSYPLNNEFFEVHDLLQVEVLVQVTCPIILPLYTAYVLKYIIAIILRAESFFAA